MELILAGAVVGIGGVVLVGGIILLMHRARHRTAVRRDAETAMGRLRELDHLRARGHITEAEYLERRRALLREL